MICANDIRTWNAIRIFSGSTRTGPQARISARTASKIARTCGSFPAKCARNEISGEQVCTWLRFANARRQLGHVQSGLGSRATTRL